MDIQDVSNHTQSVANNTPVKHKNNDENQQHEQRGLSHDEHQSNKKTTHGHTKSKAKTKATINVAGGLAMEGDFLSSLDEVIRVNQAEADTQDASNAQNNDQSLTNDNQKDKDTDDSKEKSNKYKKLDSEISLNNKKVNGKNSNNKTDVNKKNGNKKIDVTKLDANTKSAINSMGVKKIKSKLEDHHGKKSKKSTSADGNGVIKSLKDAQQEGIAGKLQKGQHVKVEVKQTHQIKAQGQSFKVSIANNQKLSASEDHVKLHQKIVEKNEEKLGTSASTNVNVNNNNMIGGGEVVNASLNNSTIGKVSADAVTGVKGASAKPSASTQNVFGGLNANKGNQVAAPKSRPTQQPKPARKHVHIASTISKVNVNIAKAVEGGADRININLRPNNMGRIDVQIDMQQKGAVVIVNVEKQDTLDMLQADSSSLQQALESTGMELQGEMQFNLQENSSGGYDQGYQGQQQSQEEEDDSQMANGVPTMEALQEARSASAESRGGVDLVL